MESGLFNISSASITTLISKGNLAGAIKSITIANCSSSNPATIRLFLSDGTNDTSIVDASTVQNANQEGNVVNITKEAPVINTSFLEGKPSYDDSGLNYDPSKRSPNKMKSHAWNMQQSMMKWKKNMGGTTKHK